MRIPAGLSVVELHPADGGKLSRTLKIDECISLALNADDCVKPVEACRRHNRYMRMITNSCLGSHLRVRKCVD